MGSTAVTAVAGLWFRAALEWPRGWIHDDSIADQAHDALLRERLGLSAQFHVEPAKPAAPDASCRHGASAVDVMPKFAAEDLGIRQSLVGIAIASDVLGNARPTLRVFGNLLRNGDEVAGFQTIASGNFERRRLI